jgi:hypothetical protein
MAQWSGPPLLVPLSLPLPQLLLLGQPPSLLLLLTPLLLVTPPLFEPLLVLPLPRTPLLELDVPPLSPEPTRPPQAMATPPSASRSTRKSPPIPSRIRASYCSTVASRD